MGRYQDQKATRGALEQVEKHKTEAARLKDSIRKHHRQVHAGNWGADDELWATLGLEADPEVIG